MTVNPHLTDQYLATLGASPAGEVPDAVAPVLVKMLTEGLPGLDPRLLGEIVLHVAVATSKLSMTLEQRASGPGATTAVAAITAVALAKAGEQLYTGRAS